MSEILFTTTRLLGRVFTNADAEAFSAYRSDPDIAIYQGWDTPVSLAKAQEFIAEMRMLEMGMPGLWYQIALERNHSPGLIGDVAFHILRRDDRQAEIGYTISGSHQQQGYGSEGVSGLLGFLFQEFGLHRVTATCDTENTASICLLQKLGFRQEGHFIENYSIKGQWRSDYLFALLAREWESRNL